MGERDSINVVSDQQGCPTYAADLAQVIMEILIQNSLQEKTSEIRGSNVYHYSNDGITKWYEFAIAIKDLSGKNCSVNPITTAEYPTLAKRPLYSVMDTSKIRDTFNLAIPFWKDSLVKCLQEF